MTQIIQMIEQIQKYQSHRVLIDNVFIRMFVQHGLNHILHQILNLRVFFQSKKQIMWNRVLLPKRSDNEFRQNVFFMQHTKRNFKELR